MNAASGEFGDGDSPAKKRAVSSAVADAKLCTGAALSASTSVVRMAIIVLSINKHTVCDDRDPFKAKATGMPCFRQAPTRRGDHFHLRRVFLLLS